ALRRPQLRIRCAGGDRLACRRIHPILPSFNRGHLKPPAMNYVTHQKFSRTGVLVPLPRINFSIPACAHLPSTAGDQWVEHFLVCPKCSRPTELGLGRLTSPSL